MRRRGGPTPYLRLDLGVRVDQATQVNRLHGDGATFAQIAERTGLSLTTCWRRFWWYRDWSEPAKVARPIRRIPPQRGTAACPRGRPCIPELDHPEIRGDRLRRCGARRKSDGQGCGCWAMRGQRVCRMHGGASPQARRAAAQRVAAAKRRRAVGYLLHELC
jgi:hypothetical protein